MPFNYITIIIGIATGFILFYKIPTLKRTSDKAGQPTLKISVIIPARNEEKNLPGILSDLKAQTYALHEIICVDDCSEDATADIIKESGAVYIGLDCLPDGWKGKPWACQNGADAASGDVLLFLDADVRLSETAVGSLAREYASNGRAVSVLPYHTVTKQHEFFSLFFSLIKTCATYMSLMGAKKTHGLYGPVLMIKKELFDSNDGFESVRQSVAEDLCLGMFYSRHDLDVALFAGGGQISFRMYPNSFNEVFGGWAKNFSRGSISIKLPMAIMIFLWLASCNAVIVESVRGLASSYHPLLAPLAAAYLIIAMMTYQSASRIGSYPLYVCLLFPVYLMVFELIFIYSIVATFITKSTAWKGRRV